MIKNKSILVVILARGGSKRLPGKNIRSLGGKPMIVWSIEAAKNSKYVDKVLVSTDSQEIADIARKAGAEVPFLRPARLAADETSSEDALIHAVNEISKDGSQFDILVHLQPTTPLRNSKHLDESLELFANKGAKSLVSVMKVDKNPYWVQAVDKNGIMKPHFKRKGVTWTDPPKEPLYMPNGAIYIMWVNNFLKDKKRYTDKTVPYIMDITVSVDIDEEIEFNMAEFFLKLSQKK